MAQNLPISLVYFWKNNQNCCHQILSFKARMHQVQFRLEISYRPRWGTSQRSPRSPSWISAGPTSKGREGRERGEDKEKREGTKGGKGRWWTKGEGVGKGRRAPPLNWNFWLRHCQLSLNWLYSYYWTIRFCRETTKARLYESQSIETWCILAKIVSKCLKYLCLFLCLLLLFWLLSLIDCCAQFYNFSIIYGCILMKDLILFDPK